MTPRPRGAIHIARNDRAEAGRPVVRSTSLDGLHCSRCRRETNRRHSVLRDRVEAEERFVRQAGHAISARAQIATQPWRQLRQVRAQAAGRPVC